MISHKCSVAAGPDDRAYLDRNRRNSNSLIAGTCVDAGVLLGEFVLLNCLRLDPCENLIGGTDVRPRLFVEIKNSFLPFVNAVGELV